MFFWAFIVPCNWKSHSSSPYWDLRVIALSNLGAVKILQHKKEEPIKAIIDALATNFHVCKRFLQLYTYKAFLVKKKNGIVFFHTTNAALLWNEASTDVSRMICNFHFINHKLSCQGLYYIDDIIKDTI